MARCSVSVFTFRAACAALLATAAACTAGEEKPAMPTTPQPIEPASVAGFEQAHMIGSVMIAGQPTPLLLANARDDGFKVVINVRPSGEMTYDEAALVKGLGMRYVAIPVTFDTLDDAKVQAFMGEIRKGDGKVLAHCSNGNRIAALWAMYEITDLKVKPEEAVARARSVGLRDPDLIAYIGEYSRRVGAW